jgi:hypothetical protein
MWYYWFQMTQQCKNNVNSQRIIWQLADTLKSEMQRDSIGDWSLQDSRSSRDSETETETEIFNRQWLLFSSIRFSLAISETRSGKSRRNYAIEIVLLLHALVKRIRGMQRGNPSQKSGQSRDWSIELKAKESAKRMKSERIPKSWYFACNIHIRDYVRW